MSVQQEANRAEFATIRAAVPAGITENIASVEASEDRLLLYGMYASPVADQVFEVSFSGNQNFDSANTDDTASGVILLSTQVSRAFVKFPREEAPVWDAGEEIHVHADNQSGGQQFVVVNLAYIPVGEFLRSRLRNR